jgi:hypothetical protein
MDILKIAKKHEEKKHEDEHKEKGKEVAKGFFAKKKDADGDHDGDKEKDEKGEKEGKHEKCAGLKGVAEKVKAHMGRHPMKYLAATQIGLPIAGAAAHGALANTEAGKKTSVTRAEAAGHKARGAEEIRKKHLGHYALNPHAAGPLSEIGSRLSRRHHAAKAEHPYKSSMIPLYSVIKGGKAGADKK